MIECDKLEFGNSYFTVTLESTRVEEEVLKIRRRTEVLYPVNS